MKRLFIGISIQSDRVSRIQETWKSDEKLNTHVLKWVKPENWHITLVFLGDTEETKIELLQKLIEDSFANIPAFSTELKGAGLFPNTHHPKVLWLGLEDLQPLMPAQLHLVESLTQNGFPMENKPFKPHLTLARIKNTNQRTSFESLLKHFNQSTFGTVVIKQVVLFESILLPGGPVYQPVYVKNLTNPISF